MESRLVGGRYAISKKIGEGGAAHIYLADDQINNIPVALKIPIEEDPKLYDSLRREYLFSATHNHLSLQRPLDITFESSKPIIVTPYIDGIEIDEYFRVLRKSTDIPYCSAIAGKLFARVLEAAGFIHFCGYCHNDYKPSNIVVFNGGGGASPDLKIIDFNLVSKADDGSCRRGTLHYLAPEIIHGEPVSPLSDVYSLGILFYELLAGYRPFDYGEDAVSLDNLTGNAVADMSGIPTQFREGLSLMMNRDPRKRPAGASRAAEALGIHEDFEKLQSARIGDYLAAGPPPFADDLEGKFESFKKSGGERIFVIYGYSYSARSLDFLEAGCRIRGIRTVRIGDSTPLDEIIGNPREFSPVAKENYGETVIIMENLEERDPADLKRLEAIARDNKDLHIAGTAARWFNPNLRHETFDPARYRDRGRMTEMCVTAFMKRKPPKIKTGPLSEKTGGDPEQVYRYLSCAGARVGLESLEKELDYGNPPADFKIPENEKTFSALAEKLDPIELESASRLSAWGDTVPYLMLINLNKELHETVDRLTVKRILIRHKDSLSFLSGDLREYIYGRIDMPAREKYHRFWAKNAEELVSDGYERLELTAFHWARSGDSDRAVKYNLAAAGEFFKGGLFSKALRFAEFVTKASTEDPKIRPSALRVAGDINAAIGRFKTARKMYLEALSRGPDPQIRAEIDSALGKIYLRCGCHGKSLYYLKRSLGYFKNAGDVGNISACSDLIVKASWQAGDYRASLPYLPYHGREEIAQSPEVSETTSIDILNKGLSLYTSSRNQAMAVCAHIELGRDLMKRGKLEEAAGHFETALQISEKRRDKTLIIDSLLFLGVRHLNSGDLFMAIECFHNARQAAESLGNEYLRVLAELKLTDISILMGNHSLAMRALNSIRDDLIYNEDRQLRLKTDLRIARLYQLLGDNEESLRLAGRISRAAGVAGNRRLELQADIVAAESRREMAGGDSIEEYKALFYRARKYNYPELMAELQLVLGQFYGDRKNRICALHYFEELCLNPTIPRATNLESEIRRIELLAENGDYESWSDKLMEIESAAAATGFIPIAVQAARALGQLQVRRGRSDLYEECGSRFRVYSEKLLSAIPAGFRAERYKRKLILANFEPTAGPLPSETAEHENEPQAVHAGRQVLS